MRKQAANSSNAQLITRAIMHAIMHASTLADGVKQPAAICTVHARKRRCVAFCRVKCATDALYVYRHIGGMQQSAINQKA